MANDTYSAAACRRVVFASVWVVGMERTQSAASETQEAARESEFRPPYYTADEFLTGAGSKHAQIMRSAAIELLGTSRFRYLFSLILMVIIPVDGLKSLTLSLKVRLTDLGLSS
jgi:hypothetical protein